jgi:CHAT domain
MEPTTRSAARAAIEAVEPAYDEMPAFSDADLDRARTAAEVVRAGGDEASGIGPDDLVALSPDEAGRLAEDLASAGRMDALAMVVTATPPHRYPLTTLLRAAAQLSPELWTQAMLVRAVALAPARRLGAALDEVADDPTLDDVLAQVAAERTSLAAGPPYRWWHERETTMAEPPEDDGRGSAGEEAPGAGAGAGDEETVYRGPEGKTRKAYPRLDVTGTPRPDVVVLDQPFEVVLGIQQRRDSVIVGTSALVLQEQQTVDLDVVLLFDPDSIEVTGSPRARITVTDLDPYPSATFTCTARYGEDLAAERRVGMQLLRDGQVVGVAWRTVVAADSADRVADAEVPDRRDVDLLDLDPLLGTETPDLVISVCASDAGATTFVWTAYASDPTIPVPDLPSTSTLDGEVAEFATMIRRTIEFSGGAADDYYNLAGRAVQIGRSVPEGIQQAVRHVVEAGGRTTAPAVLLLTEELVVPWELATFEPELATTWGGASPFLGAHVALARWPLDEHKPRPRPRSNVAVRQAAVLTADYTGVPSWKKLESALAEATEVSALFSPPATQVLPELLSVIDVFSGRPEYDVLHAALHGKYDAQGAQEGIVLLKKSPAGGATAQFLTPTMLETGSLPHGPFVFLNACQVASDESVLGDYAGFASTLMRIGAAGVVAPLWNVRDDVAATVARAFYAAALADAPVSAAEAMRAIRATYTEAAARTDDPQQHATLVAYQVFGHPRLMLTRTSPDQP